jgi:hypothetical protein
MMRIRTVLLLALLPVAHLAAQEPVAERPRHIPPAVDSTAVTDSVTPRPAPPNCWRPQRRPPCEGFFLTQIGVEVPALGTRRDDPAELRRRDFGARLVWTFGFMGTTGRHSHGGAFSFTSEPTAGGRLPHVIEYRYRNWLGANAAIDAAVGYKVADTWKNGSGLFAAKGMTAMAGFTANRWIGVAVRGDLIRAAGRERRALMIGVHSTRGSELALKYTAILLLRTALAAIGIEWEDEEP